MLKVGLTGGIGSGKSYLSEIFRNLGVNVFNADMSARWLLDNDRDLIMDISALFGENIYINTKFDRKRAAGMVFENKDMLEKMNDIIHPAVLKRFELWAGAYLKEAYVLKEAAIIFESGANEYLDKVITVSAPEELRIKRVIERDSMSRDEVLKRMKNQWNDEDRMEKADYVIINDGKEMLIPQVLDIHRSLQSFN